MSDLDATIVTAYGRLDRAALTRAQNNYDTAALLSAVDEFDKIIGHARGQDGLRFGTFSCNCTAWPTL